MAPFGGRKGHFPRYAAGADWYQRNERIVFRGLYHIKYGLPRALPAHGLVRVGEYRGVGVFADSGYTVPNDFIYIPERTGCVFQAYEPPHRPE